VGAAHCHGLTGSGASASPIACATCSVASLRGRPPDASIQNISGLPQGLAGRPAAGWRCERAERAGPGTASPWDPDIVLPREVLLQRQKRLSKKRFFVMAITSFG
jgi:hypothetical protein